jgi:hypothetical protein
MITIVNVGQSKFTIKDGQEVKSLAPLKEMKVHKEVGMLLVNSFPREIKIVKEEVQVIPEVVIIPKKKEGKK